MPDDTSPADPQHQLTQWATKDGPAKIITALCAHLEAGHSWGHAELPVDLTPQQRREVRGLLGTRWDASGRGVTPHMLKTRMIKQGLDPDTALRQLIGRDLANRRTQLREHRGNAAAERQHALDTLIEAGVSRVGAETWLDRRGLPPAGRGQLLSHVKKIAAVWRHLPNGSDTIMLSVLADAACDDPHALDRRAGRLGLDILRLANGNAFDAEDKDIEGWRTAWDALGVVCDPLSSRVLVLNLALTGTAAACAIAAAGCQTGEPIWLTWRCLNGDFALDHSQSGQDRRVDVYVCENPTVVAAAADALGARTHPLVCTNGVPSGAVRKLLAGLARTGARLIIRADDDPAGQAIVQQLMSLVPGAALWRYSQRSPSRAAEARQYEERVLDTLLTDLARD